MEPQCDEQPTDWKNLFAIMRFCYIKVLFYVNRYIFPFRVLPIYFVVSVNSIEEPFFMER